MATSSVRFIRPPHTFYLMNETILLRKYFYLLTCIRLLGQSISLECVTTTTTTTLAPSTTSITTTTSTTAVIMTTESKELMLGNNNEEVKSAENGLSVELLIGKNCNIIRIKQLGFKKIATLVQFNLAVPLT